MVQESRTRKTFLNARVNLIFYFLTLLLSFFSRKIFLDILGADFIGLTGTLQNLLGFLNIAELGIGTAIGYVLYKPLFQKDQAKINEIVSVLGYMYRWVGKIILLSGFVLSLFLPLIFPDTRFNLIIIYTAYYAFLTSALIGYFVNYRQTLLSADQKNYVVTAYFQTANILKTIIQLFVAFYTRNYYLWIVIEFIYVLIYTSILNWKINKVYPWLKSDVKKGKELYNKYPQIIKNTKQIFVHKIGAIVQFQLTPFLVYAYVSLHTVAFYGNYSLIIDKINVLLGNFLDSTAAGIGNLIVEGNKKNILKVYWELLSIRFFCVGVITISLYHIVPVFIEIWLGKEYVLSNSILIFVLFIFCLNTLRGTTDQFINGYGLFYDIWSPIAESVIFFIVAIIGGSLCGLEGILLGNVLSLTLIIHTWKPYFLFTKGFKISIWNYYFNFGKLTLLSGLAFYTYIYIQKQINFILLDDVNWKSLFLYSINTFTLAFIINFLYLYIGFKGMRNFIHRIVNSLK